MTFKEQATKGSVLQIKREDFYLELQKSQFQDVAEKERISSAAYHSYSKGRENKHGL